MYRFVPVLIAISLYGQSAPLSAFDPLTIVRLNTSGTTLVSAITTDFAGNIYVAANTDTPDLAVPGGLAGQPYAGGGDVFVAKFSPGGVALWATYLGGSGQDIASAISVDSAGNIYVAGTTVTSYYPAPASLKQVSDFPVTRPRIGPAGPTGAFLAKYTPDGHLYYSVVFGAGPCPLQSWPPASCESAGAISAEPHAIAIDAAGNAFVAGRTVAPDFPATNGDWTTGFGCKSSCTGPAGFIAKFAPDASLVYASFVNNPAAVIVDSQGEVTLAGPVVEEATGNAIVGDVTFGYVLRLDATGSKLVAFAQLGGPATALAADALGNLYVAGVTLSNNFPPMPLAYVSPLQGQSCGTAFVFGGLVISQGDLYIMKLRPSDWATVYAARLGGECATFPGEIIDDAAGGVTFTAGAPPGFPVVNTLVAGPTYGTFSGAQQDSLVAKLSPDGSKLLLSTFLSSFYAPPLALAPDGSIIVSRAVQNPTNSTITYATLLRLPSDANSAPANLVGVVSAANFRPGLPPPGSLASLFCTGLDAPPGVTAASQFPLPTDLAGITITIGGQPAPILAIANSGNIQQINVQVPSEATSADVVIQASGQAFSTFAAFRKSPGDFFTNADGSGVFQHASDFSPVTPQNPAHSGETIVAYLTGVAVTGLIATNTPAPADPPLAVPQYSTEANVSTYSVSIDGMSIVPGFFGLAPGLIGVFQLNFIVPPGLASSTQQVALQHYTCSGNLSGACGANNGNPATASSVPVTIPVGQ
jgi:uncharacterized protein (TIGR03437 family)